MPRKASTLPDEAGQEDKDLQKQGDILAEQLSRVEQGTAHAEPNNDSHVPETIPVTPLEVESVQGSGQHPMDTAYSPAHLSSDEQVNNTTQNELDPLVPVLYSGKENIRAKWFLEGTHCKRPRQDDPEGEVMANGEVKSSCFKRPSVDSGNRSSQESNSNYLFPVKQTLKKRKSLSDSLLCTLPQDDKNIFNGTSMEDDENELNTDAQDIDTKQNFSKQNGSPFSHKKPVSSNGPCYKHSDEDITSHRNRTTTHPCYDPPELPKKRRNAACTVAILSPGDRGSEDFLETKI